MKLDKCAFGLPKVHTQAGSKCWETNPASLRFVRKSSRTGFPFGDN